MGSQGMGENGESSGYILKVEHRICFLDVGHEEETGQGRLQWLFAAGRRWLPFTEMREAEEGQARGCLAQRLNRELGLCIWRPGDKSIDHMRQAGIPQRMRVGRRRMKGCASCHLQSSLLFLPGTCLYPSVCFSHLCSLCSVFRAKPKSHEDRNFCMCFVLCCNTGTQNNTWHIGGAH